MRCVKLVSTITERLTICLCVYMYPFTAHIFRPIDMKLDIDPLDPGSDLWQVRLRFNTSALRYQSAKHEEEKQSVKPEARKRQTILVGYISVVKKRVRLVSFKNGEGVTCKLTYVI